MKIFETWSDVTHGYIGTFYVVESSMRYSTSQTSFGWGWHNLCGASMVDERNGICWYYINNIEINEEDYWKHPSVMECLLNNICALE